jgi:hypothetical protein
MWVVKPQKDNADNRSFIIAEIGFILFLIAMYIVGLINTDDITREKLGIGTIGVMGILFLGCWANYLASAIPEIIQKIKSKCKKKKGKVYMRKHIKST